MKNLLLILGLALSQALSAQTPPPNDLCEDAWTIPFGIGRGSTSFTSLTNVNATNSGDTLAYCAVEDVWCKFTTGNYVASKVIIDFRFNDLAGNLAYMLYDSCHGNFITGWRHASPSSTPSVDSIRRRFFRPNTTYYLSLSMVAFGGFFPLQDTFSFRIYGEDEPIPTPFVYTSLGASKSVVAKAKNKTGRPLIINNITSNNPSLIPIQRTTQSVAADAMVYVTLTHSPIDLVDDTATITVNTTQGDITMRVDAYPYGNGLVYDSIPTPNLNYIFYPRLSSTGSAVVNNQFYSHSGAGSIRSLYRDYGSNTQNLIALPVMRPRPGNDKVSFFLGPDRSFRYFSSTYPNDDIRVLLSTTDSDSSSFTIQLLQDSITEFGYRYFSVDLSAYHNTPVYVAIAHRNRFAIGVGLSVYIDDLRYPDNLSSLPEPSGPPTKLATLYPNPSSGTLTISLTENTAPDDAKAKVMDLWGRTITEYPFSGSLQKQLDLSHLPSGMYLIEVSTPTAAQTLKWAKVK